MEIDANVDAGWHSIGWVLFRKPYRWFITNGYGREDHDHLAASE